MSMYPPLLDVRRKRRFTFKLWDVGRGLSIWIKTPSGQNHWIDLGRTADFSPSRHVSQTYNVNQINCLIISHPHEDHLADLPSFIKCFGKPKYLIYNTTIPEEDKYGTLGTEWQKIFKTLDASNKSTVEWGEDIEYLIRYNNWAIDMEGNNTSLVTALLYNELLIVCPGDIEPKGWDVLWSSYSYDFNKFINRAKTIVLVAPHHGSKTTYSEKLMGVIKPHLVIISDIWGDLETHPDYRTKPLGIRQDGQLIKCFSTKRGGRVEIVESIGGGFEFYQYE